MQLSSPTGAHYLFLLPPLVTCLLGHLPIEDCLWCLLLGWLFGCGQYYHNYCNMAGCIVIGPFLMLRNLIYIAQLLKQQTSQSLWMLAFNWSCCMNWLQLCFIVGITWIAYDSYQSMRAEAYS